MWADGANWSTGVKPADVDAVVLPYAPPVGASPDTTYVDLNLRTEAAGSLSIRGGYTLTNGTLALGTGTIDVPAYNDRPANIAASLQGTVGFTKTGGGTLTLSGFANFTGPTLVAAGTLAVAQGYALGFAPDVTVAAGATLDARAGVQPQWVGTLNGGGSVNLGPGGLITGQAPTGGSGTGAGTFTGLLSGTGGFTKGGTGTLAFGSAANAKADVDRYQPVSGGFQVLGGILQLAADEAISDAAPLVVDQGGTLDLHGFRETVASLTGPGYGQVLLGNGGRLTVGGAGAPTPSTTPPGSQGPTFAGWISGTGALATRTDLTLAGYNTYAGPTSVEGGTLTAGSANALPAGTALTVARGATFAAANNVGVAVGSLDAAGVVQLSLGTLTVGSGPFGPNPGGQGTGEGRFTGLLAGFGTFVKAGTGTLTFGSPSNPRADVDRFFGTVRASGGTLRLGAAESVSDSAVLDVDNLLATVDLDGFDETVAALTGYGGEVRLTAGARLTVGTFAAAPSYPAPSFGGNISGSGGLTVRGDQTLSGTNTYSGPTNVQRGTLKVGSTTSLPAGSALTLAAGTTLDLNGNAATVGSLAGAGAVQMLRAGGVCLTVGSDGTSTEFSGNIGYASSSPVYAPAPTLVKVGGGTLTLSGQTNVGVVVAGGRVDLLENAYQAESSRTLGVNAGASLRVGGIFAAAGALAGRGDVTVSQYATLALSAVPGPPPADLPVDAPAFEGRLGGPGNLVLAPRFGLLQLGGTNTLTGTTRIAAGATTLLSDAALSATSDVSFDPDYSGVPGGTGGSLFLNGHAVTVGAFVGTGRGYVDLGAGSLTTVVRESGAFNGTVTGTGTFVKDGPGELVFGGSFKHAGATVVRAGTLSLQIGQLSPDSTVTVAAGARLALGGSNQRLGGLDGAGEVAVNDAAVDIGTNGNGASGTAFDGVLSGTGSVTKVGSAPLTLRGRNAFAGKWVVNEGTLALGRAGASFGNAPAVSVGPTGRVDLAGYDAAVASLAGGGPVTLGGGTLTISPGFVGNVLDLSFGGISGPGRLVKAGDGRQYLYGQLSFTGGLSVEGGSLEVGGAPAFDGGLTVSPGATATVYGSGTYRGGVRLGGTLQVDADAGLGAAANEVRIAGGTLRANGTFESARRFTLGDGRNGDGTFAVAAGQTLTIGSPVLGATALVKVDDGTLVLTAANAYEGGTVVRQGTLRLAAGASLYNGGAVRALVEVAGDGTIDLSGVGGLTVGAVRNPAGPTASPGGTVLLGPSTLTVDTSDGGAGMAVRFGGRVTGAGAVVKTGAGTWTLAGNNAFAGGLRVTGGEVALAADASFAGGVAVAGPAAVASAGADAHLGSAANAVALSAGGTLTARASFATARAVAVGAGGGTVRVDAGATLSAGGSVSGSGPLAKAGPGTLRLTATDPLAAAVSVNEGTLTLGGPAGALRSATAFAIANGAALVLDNATATGGGANADRAADAAPLTITGGGTVRLAGPDAAAASEHLGLLTVASGAGVVDLDPGAGPGATAAAYFAGARVGTRRVGPVTVPAGAIDFRGPGLGVTAFAFLADGLLPAGATADGGPAKYLAAYGVVPATFVPPPGGGGFAAAVGVPEPAGPGSSAVVAAAGLLSRRARRRPGRADRGRSGVDRRSSHA